MAARYWVGGTGNWNDPTHWSSISGGNGNDLLFGNELVTNGGFDNSLGWSSNSVNVYISNGKVNYTSTGGFVNSSITVSNTKMFLLTYTISDYVSGTFNVKIYTNYGNVSTNKASNGTFSEYIILNSTNIGSFTNTILLEGIGNCNFKVDNISLKEVLTYPTSSDDVIFDSNSGTGTVTVNAIANMRDCTFAQTQLITLTNAAYAFNIYGNWTLCDNAYLNTSFTGTGYVYLKATTSVNITSNGCTMAWNRLYFDGVGGSFTIQDNMNTAASIYMLNGTLIGDNKTITTGTIRVEFNANSIFTLNIPNSVLNINGYMYAVGYLNINALNSVININGNTCQFHRTNGTLNIVNLNVDNCNVYVNCLELSYTGSGYLAFRNSKINKLKINGIDSTRYRCIINSELSTSAILECDSLEFSNVDFRDIVGAGTANWDLSAITGGSGDCGGNSGIIFTTAQTQYFKHTLGVVNWSDATKWFSNYERTIAGRVPLPQDNAIFDENSFTGASTLTLNVPRLGGLLINSISQSLAVVLATDLLVFLNFKLNSANLSGNRSILFDGHNRTFTSSVYLGIPNSAPNNFTVLGNNTFAELILEPDRKVKFTAGTTQTVSKFKALGTPTNPIKIDSTTASRFNLVKTGSEPNECNFIDISNSNASPSGSWPAGYNSNDMGNNDGWEFNTDDFVPQIINL